MPSQCIGPIPLLFDHVVYGVGTLHMHCTNQAQSCSLGEWVRMKLFDLQHS